MDHFMSSLMRNYSATNIVIIRDDATISKHQRKEFSVIATSNDNEEAPQRPSFNNKSQSAGKNSAPTLPSRKQSIDDLSLIMMQKCHMRRKRTSLNDSLLSQGIKNIGNHEMPSFAERCSESQSRHKLFDELFRELDEMLKEAANE